MLINKTNPHGGDIYRNEVEHDFSANVSPLGTPDEVKDAIKKAADFVCAYPDPYCAKLIEKLSVHEKIESDKIICGNGAADLIFAFSYALKPKKALIVAPTFCEYEKSLISSGCDVEYYCLNECDGFSLSEAFLDRLNESYDVVFICNPNNPTGKAYEKDFMKKVADSCKKFGIFLFVDECFCDLTEFPENYSLKSELNSNPYIFILKAFTKSYGMAGVRLGYALSSNKNLLDKISDTTQVWNISTISQYAGIAALGCSEFLKRNKEIIKTERPFLINSLRNLSYKVFDSDTNFILFKANEDLYEKLLSHKILIRRCANFKGLTPDFYRCAVKTHTENIKLINAMEVISNAEKG